MYYYHICYTTCLKLGFGEMDISLDRKLTYSNYNEIRETIKDNLRNRLKCEVKDEDFCILSIYKFEKED